MSLRIDDDKLLKKCKTVWTKIEYKILNWAIYQFMMIDI